MNGIGGRFQRIVHVDLEDELSPTPEIQAKTNILPQPFYAGRKTCKSQDAQNGYYNDDQGSNADSLRHDGLVCS